MQFKPEKLAKQYANLTITNSAKSEKSMNLQPGSRNALDRKKGLSYTISHSAYGNRHQITGILPRNARGSLVQFNGDAAWIEA